MPLPDDVTTFTLSFGDYTELLGSPALANLKGIITPVDARGRAVKLTHAATGQVIVPAPVEVTIGADGTASVGPLPHTDNPGLAPAEFLYSVQWSTPSNRPSPGNAIVAVPQASGSVVDFDLLAPAPSSAPVNVTLPQVTSVAGYAGAVSAAQLAAGLRPTFGPLPAYAGGRSHHFDPARSVYNLKSSNTRRVRAALGSARAGTGICRLAFAGDSTTAGQTNARGTDDAVSLLRAEIGRRGYGTGELIHCVTGGIPEPRLTFSGFPAGGNSFPWASSQAAGDTITHTGTGTVLAIVGSGFGAAWTYSIDGGAAVTVTPPGGVEIVTTTVTGLSAGSHTVVITATDHDAYIYAVGFRPAAGIAVDNGGLSGATTADWLPDTGNFTNGLVMGHANYPRPDAVFVELGLNDVFDSIAAAASTTNLTKLVDRFKALGTSVFLVASHGISGDDADWTAYVSDVLYDLADSGDLPLLDLRDRWGTYAETDADGTNHDLISDGLHLTPAGNAAKMRAWLDLLTV